MHHYRNTQRALLALLTGCLRLLLPAQGEAQKVAGKVNLLYGATTARTLIFLYISHTAVLPPFLFSGPLKGSAAFLRQRFLQVNGENPLFS